MKKLLKHIVESIKTETKTWEVTFITKSGVLFTTTAEGSSRIDVKRELDGRLGDETRVLYVKELV